MFWRGFGEIADLIYSGMYRSTLVNQIVTIIFEDGRNNLMSIFNNQIEFKRLFCLVVFCYLE